MNPATLAEAKHLTEGVKKRIEMIKDNFIVICVPFPYISELAKISGRSSRFLIGAQDLSPYDGGAHTGEVGASMIASAGGKAVIIGHSESRSSGDSDAVINAKMKMALKNNLYAIFCVGEKERDAHGAYLKIIEGQIRNGLNGLPKSAAARITIAYEPVWAIGENAKGADTPEAFREISIFIRKAASHIFDPRTVLDIPVLYGGSVTADNAGSFLNEGQADGLLVGRESLKPDRFAKIVKR